VLLGGAKEDVDRVEPAVRAYAGTVIRTGDLGSALVLKLINNIVFTANVQVALEVARLAGQAGIAMSSVYEVFAASSGGTKAIGVMEQFGAPQAFADQVRPFLVKDVAACEHAAAQLGLDLGLLGHIARSGRLDVRQPSGRRLLADRD
jgi:3-hydroxyisobutyrate dehydrogenase-like beta-hydroxyacid dehydrogenase